jgi:hypothetical protein
MDSENPSQLSDKDVTFTAQLPGSIKQLSTSISPFTISVFTRHSKTCPKANKGPQFKGCKCRKSLYIRENGKTTYVSAKTRSFEQAERVKRAEMEKRDPLYYTRLYDYDVPRREKIVKEYISAPAAKFGEIYLIHGEPISQCGLIGYIGQTTDAKQRKEVHLKGNYDGTRILVETIKAKGCIPTYTKLVSCSAKHLNEQEREWYTKYKLAGWALFNRLDLTQENLSCDVELQEVA